MDFYLEVYFMKLKKRIYKKRIKYSALSYVTYADIENEEKAFMLLIRSLSLDAFSGVGIKHMKDDKFSPYDFIFKARNGTIILDVKTVSNNFFAVGEEKMKRWEKIDAHKFILYLDVETKSKITLKNITNVDFSKMRKKINRSGGVYYDLRSIPSTDFYEFEILIYSPTGKTWGI